MVAAETVAMAILLLVGLEQSWTERPSNHLPDLPPLREPRAARVD
jgi:hypothetical protein